MATELYFDTARLGRMCPSARKAEQDFSKLASQLGSSLYWERFLTQGYGALPPSLRRRSPALSCWSGLAGLKHGLAEFASLPAGGKVLLAGQSCTLITLAAECLFQKCTRVLATDLEWPPYLAILKRIAVRHGKTLCVLSLRHQVLIAGCNRQELAQSLVSRYFRSSCDGLFLSDITHTGVKVPYADALQTISRFTRPKFTVIDGAQAFGQRPVRLNGGEANLYLAGTQKWFGAFHPLRLAFISPEVTNANELLMRLLSSHRLCDPLAEFCHGVSTGNWRVFGETVNLSALMTAAGALEGWMRSPRTPFARWRNRRMNRRLVLDAISPLADAVIDDTLSAGIALLKVRVTPHAAFPCRTSLREAFGHHYIAATEPLRGMIRLAMPDVPLSSGTLDRVRHAFSRVAESQGLPPVDVSSRRVEASIEVQNQQGKWNGDTSLF
jgi:hypothetical protein